MFRSGRNSSHPLKEKVVRLFKYGFFFIALSFFGGEAYAAPQSFKKTPFPPYLHHQFEKILQMPLSHLEFKRLGQGLTIDDTYAVIPFSLSGKPLPIPRFVVKILSPTRILHQRQYTVKIYRHMDHLGVGPKIHFSHGQDGILIMEFIEGRHFHHSEIQDPVLFKNLIAIIKKYHHSFFKLPNVQNPFYMRVQRRVQELKLNDLNLKGLLLKFTQGAPLKNHTSLVHTDLKFSNILITPQKKIYIVDWADSCPGHPLIDLASLAHHGNLTASASAEDKMINHYYGRPLNDPEQKIYNWYKDLSFLHTIAWALRQYCGNDLINVDYRGENDKNIRPLLDLLYEGQSLSPNQLKDLGHRGMAFFIKEILNFN